MPGPVLTHIRVAADPAAWAAAGFSVTGRTLQIDDVTIEFEAGDTGTLGWTLARSGDVPLSCNPPPHANHVTRIDHVVMLAPDLEKTIANLERQGVELRRIREGDTGMGKFRQAFFRVGRPILEVVESAELDHDEPARLWGITFATADIDAAAALLGGKLGRVKDAVQPGRRIATVRKEAGLGLPIALISAKP